jgi:hypothetical protein
MRLPDETAEWLKNAARRAGRSVSDVGATLFEEARRMSEFAEIEFRPFGGERQACLKGSVRLWKLILTAQGHDMDVAKTAAHLDLTPWKVQAAFHYYEAFPQEIDAAIADVKGQSFNTLKRKLPQIERQAVVIEETTDSAETGETSATDSSEPTA